MELSSFNEILYNDNSSNIKIWKKIKPVRFAIPVIIYKVNVIKNTNVVNIFYETIINLNNLGKNTKEIASIMCIDERMVESALEERKSRMANDGTTIPKKEEEIQYIVYDCYNQQFYDSYINTNDVQEKLRSDDALINPTTGRISFVKSFGDSRKIVAHILKSKKEIASPDEKDIREYIEARKKDLYDRSTVYQYENLYETHYAFLICTYFVPMDDPTQRIVLDPIYGTNLANNVKNNFMHIMYKDSELNSEIQNELDELEEEVKLSSQASALDYGEIDKEFQKIVQKKYSEGEKNNKYSSIESVLVSLEKAFSPFSDNEYVGKDEAFKLEASKKFAVAVQNVIENLFALIVVRHADGSTCKNARNIDHKAYEHYVKNIGFEADEDTMKTFLKKANGSIVKGVISNARSFDKIRQYPIQSLIMASILLTYGYDERDTMYQLAKTFPQLLRLIKITGVERRDGKHDNDTMKIFSIKEAEERYLFVTKVVCVLLDINANVTTEKIDVENVKSDIISLVEEALKPYKIDNDGIRRKAFDMVKAWIQKDEDFFGKCYNCITEIFYEAMYAFLTDELVSEILDNMPEDKEGQLLQVNEILQLSGINDRIKTKANKEKARNVDEFKKINVSALMYIYIILAFKYEPLLLEKTKKDFSGIFDITEIVKEKRGHNNKTDFSDKTINFEEIMNKILDYSTKLVESENE